MKEKYCVDALYDRQVKMIISKAVQLSPSHVTFRSTRGTIDLILCDSQLVPQRHRVCIHDPSIKKDYGSNPETANIRCDLFGQIWPMNWLMANDRADTFLDVFGSSVIQWLQCYPSWDSWAGRPNTCSSTPPFHGACACWRKPQHGTFHFHK